MHAELAGGMPLAAQIDRSASDAAAGLGSYLDPQLAAISAAQQLKQRQHVLLQQQRAAAGRLQQQHQHALRAAAVAPVSHHSDMSGAADMAQRTASDATMATSGMSIQQAAHGAPQQAAAAVGAAHIPMAEAVQAVANSAPPMPPALQEACGSAFLAQHAYDPVEMALARANMLRDLPHTGGPQAGHQWPVGAAVDGGDDAFLPPVDANGLLLCSAGNTGGNSGTGGSSGGSDVGDMASRGPSMLRAVSATKRNRSSGGEEVVALTDPATNAVLYTTPSASVGSAADVLGGGDGDDEWIMQGNT